MHIHARQSRSSPSDRRERSPPPQSQTRAKWDPIEPPERWRRDAPGSWPEITATPSLFPQTFHFLHDLRNLARRMKRIAPDFFQHFHRRLRLHHRRFRSTRAATLRHKVLHLAVFQRSLSLGLPIEVIGYVERCFHCLEYGAFMAFWQTRNMRVAYTIRPQTAIVSSGVGNEDPPATVAPSDCGRALPLGAPITATAPARRPITPRATA